jgi:hypothetical protein
MQKADKVEQQLKDRQDQRQAYINKINETQVKLSRVEEQIRKLKGGE